MLQGTLAWVVGVGLLFVGSGLLVLAALGHASGLEAGAGVLYAFAGLLAVPPLQQWLRSRVLGQGLTPEVATRWVFLVTVLASVLTWFGAPGA